MNSIIVISGGGPGGLATALECASAAALSGTAYQITVLEKREVGYERRQQPVIINKLAMERLNQYKVLEKVFEKNFAYPARGNRITVRLGDLEECMIERLKDLRQQVIYNVSITAIEDTGTGLTLSLSNGDLLSGVKTLINSEGYYSKINLLLGNDREFLTGSIMGVYGILGVTEQRQNGCLNSIYYYGHYLARAIFAGEHFWSPLRNIALAATLQSPGQSRVGFAAAPALAEKICVYQEAIKEGKASPQDYDDFLRFWIRMAQCQVNLISLGERVAEYLVGRVRVLEYASLNDSIHNICVSNACSTRIQNPVISFRSGALCFVIGDALTTVDPSAVQGCNNAIRLAQTVAHCVTKQLEGGNSEAIMTEYKTVADRLIGDSHTVAEEMRERFYKGFSQSYSLRAKALLIPFIVIASVVLAMYNSMDLIEISKEMLSRL